MARFHFTLFALLAVLSTRSTAVSTFYVGTCKIGAFGTIGAAVSSATVPAGSIINVCPGNDPEQVVISKALTLKGVFSSNSSQAVIAMPAGLTTTSSLSTGGTVAAQVEVTATGVNITNITVDGTATSTNCPTVDYIGIFYSSGSSGTVNGVETRNQNCSGSPFGIGIVAENGTGAAHSVTIENSNVNSFSGVGIWSCSNQNPSTLTASIKGNVTAFGIDGIVVTCNSGSGGVTNAAGSVSGNTIFAASNTSVFAESASTAISGNTIVYGAGIAVLAATSVTSNHISNTTTVGIGLEVPGATVKGNTITQAPGGIGFNCHTGTVSGNIINGAAIGIDMVPAAFTEINTFYNVPTVRTGGAC